MDSIPPALLTGGGLTGVLTFLIIALSRGWIVPVSWVDRLMADKDARIALLEEANDRLTSATQSFAVSTQTAAHALHSIEKQAAKAGDES